MRYVNQSDFVSVLETRDVLKGKIYKIDAKAMCVDISVEGFSEIIQSVPIKPVYCSNVCNSSVVVMPRIGDIVWLGRSQGEWFIVGYVAERVIDKEGKDIKTHMLAKQKVETDAEDKEKTGKKRGAKIYELQPGDVGFFVHEDDRALSLMLLKGGRIVMGFGAGTVIYNQDEVAQRKLLNKYRSIDANKGLVEWGLPEVKLADEMTVTKYKEFVFKVKTGDDKDLFQFGYIDDGVTGEPEKSKFGENLRFRFRIDKYEINMDEKGNAYITVNDVRIEAHNEDIIISGYKKENISEKYNLEVGEDYNINVSGKCVLKANGDIEIESDGDINIKVDGDAKIDAGGDVKINGDMNALVLESVLPLLEKHRHYFKGKGKVLTPIGLSGISDKCKTKTIFVE